MVDKKMRTLKQISISFGKLGLVVLALASIGVYANETPAAAEKKAARVKEAEEMLSNLGYWITKVDGRSDDSTRQAVIAFQKVEGMKRTGVLDDRMVSTLRLATRAVAKHQGPAHVEIDITKQVILL